MIFFFFKQKTAYEMRISDWSSDVCSSDLHHRSILVDKLEQRDTMRGNPAVRPVAAHRRGAGGQGELMGDVAVVDCDQHPLAGAGAFGDLEIGMRIGDDRPPDRKSTRLHSSH